MTRPLILLTNDDGITSPGLAAAAAALDSLGELLIVAPTEQQSGTGRSMPVHSDGRIFETIVSANGHTWKAFSVNATPAQAVQHAVLELASRKPALAVSGINFGENVGLGVTISGTVGAALEAAAHRIPALAVSLQVDQKLHYYFDDSVDFSVAGHFTRLFAKRWLNTSRPDDVDVLKIEVPSTATPDTDWRATRLERRAYFVPVPPTRLKLNDEGRIGYKMVDRPSTDNHTDVGALRDGFIAVTPLSLDMTARVKLDILSQLLNHG
jgi:5'-nucleotidase